MMTTFALLFLFSLPFLQAQDPCDSLVPERKPPSLLINLFFFLIF